MNKEYIPVQKTFKTKEILRCPENHFLIVALNTGNARIIINDLEKTVKEGELVVFKAGNKAVLIPQGKTAITTMTISKDRLLELSQDDFNIDEKLNYVPYDVAIVHIDVKEYLILMNILNRLISIQTDEFRFGLDLYERCLLTSFMVLLLRACVKSDQIHRQNSRKTLIIDDVFLYIQRNISEDLSLKRLEDIFHVSGEHLSRKFKESTGISIHAYINKYRIDLACRYLLEGKNVREICDLVGYKSYNHFFKVFKNMTRCTPKEYLANYRNNPIKKIQKPE